jgi:hypothetical protein
MVRCWILERIVKIITRVYKNIAGAIILLSYGAR